MAVRQRRNEVTANIRAEMARRGHTQTSLAKSVKQQQQWLSRRLTGQTQISVDDLALIAGALGVSIAALVGE